MTFEILFFIGAVIFSLGILSETAKDLLAILIPLPSGKVKEIMSTLNIATTFLCLVGGLIIIVNCLVQLPITAKYIFKGIQLLKSVL
jgi:hypothetical protein